MNDITEAMSPTVEGGHAELSYHWEDGAWVASCPQLPSLFAGDRDLSECKRLASQVVRDELSPASIVHKQAGCR